MMSSSPGSVQVVAKGLRQAVLRANSSLTLQEGLYRAYQRDLCDLLYFDDVPIALETELQSVLAELRSVFGFDETTGAKLAAPTLGRKRAAAILAHLEKIAASTEALAERLAAR